jgi:hypothetical protein
MTRRTVDSIICLIDGVQLFIAGVLVGILATKQHQHVAAFFMLAAVWFAISLYRDSQ